MATVAPRANTPATADTKNPRKAGWRPLRWLVRFILVVLVLVGVSPWIISLTPLRNTLAQVGLNVNGNVNIGSCSLAWWSPIGVENFEIVDAAGKPFLKIPSISGDKSLGSLALDPTQPGKFVVDGAELHIVLREQSSNVEEIFANWLNQPPKDSTPGKSPTLALDLKNATVILHDETVNREWRMENLNVQLALDSSQPHPIQINAETSIPFTGARGQLAIQVQAGGGDAAGGNANTQITVLAASVPLPMFQAVVRRAAPGARVDGKLAAELKGEFAGSGKDLRAKLKGSAVVDQLAFSAPATNGDTFALQKVQVPCDVTIVGEQVLIETLGLQCDVGEFAVKGLVNLNDQVAKALPGSLLREKIAAEGHLDIARLAQLLPNTLRIRAGTQITGGRVKVNAQSVSGAKGQEWLGNVETENLTALNEGRTVSWEKPISAAFAAHDTAAGPAIDSVSVTSSFLRAQAQGTTDAFNIKADYDLSKLVSELEKFVDLRQFRVAGTGSANLAFERGNDNRFAGGGTVDVQGLQLAAFGWNVAAQTSHIDLKARYSATTIDCEQLNAKIQQLQAAGSLQLNEPNVVVATAARYEPSTSRIQLANFSLQTQTAVVSSESLQVVLGSSLPAVDGLITIQGDLGRLQQATTPPGVTPNYYLVGGVAGTAKLQRTNNGQTINTQMRGENLALWTLAGATARDPQLRKPTWQDPKVDVTANATYDPAGERVAVDSCDIMSNSLRLQLSGKIDKLNSSQDADITGRVDYDLEKVTPLLWPYLGQSFSLIGKDAMQFSFKGSVASLASAAQPATPGMLRPVSNGPQAVVGTSVKPAWHEIDAQARFGWEGAQVYGLRMGRGELAALARQGEIQVKPIDFDIAGGHLTLLPEIKQGNTGTEVWLPKGPVLRQVQATAEMCETGLKFVSPLLAAATDAHGSISLDLVGLKMPLADPPAVAAEGKITIHQLEVAPGGIGNVYVSLIQDIESLVTRKDPRLTKERMTLKVSEQGVDFAVADRRVYHKDITMTVADYSVRSGGSVGFDESMDVVVNVVLPERLANNPVVSRIPNRTIAVPLKGTLSRWQVDVRGALGQLTTGALGSLLGGATGQAGNQANDAINKGQDQVNDFLNKTDKKVNDTINKGLDRLFNPK